MLMALTSNFFNIVYNYTIQQKNRENYHARAQSRRVRERYFKIAITSIVATPLSGQSPKGGWSNEIKPEDSIHTLIAVHTDAGITGYGSVFADGRLVQAALDVMSPLSLGKVHWNLNG
ncbi:hypothetical protein LN650_31735 [Klebsiella pneumoniae subsp. pneumoniae]|nr:hypothetical protein [Klebsiella pneumoniae subsp. pneumoniae]